MNKRATAIPQAGWWRHEEQSALIRDFVLSHAGSGVAGNHARDLWAGFDLSWWNKSVKAGWNRYTRLTLALNHWLAMRTGEPIHRPETLDAFRRQVDAHGLRFVLSRAQSDLALYRNFACGMVNGTQSFLRVLKGTRLYAVTPVAMALLPAGTHARTPALGMLESYLIRRKICRAGMSGFNNYMAVLAGLLRNCDPALCGQVVSGYLGAVADRSLMWHVDSDVGAGLGRVSDRTARLILGELELHLRNQFGARPWAYTLPHNLALVRVMPGYTLARDAGWSRQFGLDRSLGNLMLMPQKFKRTAYTPWSDRREAIRGQHLLINREVWLRETWDEAAVRERRRGLAQLVQERWPGPGSPVWDALLKPDRIQPCDDCGGDTPA